MAVHLAFKEGRIGKKRGCNRLQSQSHAKFFHHIGFRRKIEINLYGASAPHHRAAHCAHLAHIGVHQLITPLGHQPHLFLRPDGCGPEADKSDTYFVGNFFHLSQVLVHLVTGFMDGFKRSTRKFQSAARLKAHVCAVFGQSDKIAVFLKRRPMKLIAQPLQNGEHRPLTVIGQGGQRVFAIAEFFMFRTNAPITFRFIAFFKQGSQLVKAFDRASARLWNRHGGTLRFP